MPATAAARRVAATPARRATGNRTALKPRPRPAQPKAATRARASTRAKAAAPRPRARRGNTPVTGFVPVVVGRTAGAVGGLADSGVVVTMTRSRIWIGVLGALLVGIVALNVWALDISASSSEVARQTDSLKRANSILHAQIMSELSNDQIQATAANVGLIEPEPGTIRFLETGGDAAAIAARRLADGDFALGAVAPVITEVPVEVALPLAPEATAPVAEPTATDPAVEPTVAPPPATVTPPGATAGGVVSP